MARVLVIDKDPQIRQFFRISLGAGAHRVTEASSAAEALRPARGRKFDLIILEPDLPDGDGLNLVSAVLDRYATPTIVLSSCGDEAAKVEALDRGAADYVVKPFGVGEMMARIRAALRQSRPANRPGRVVVGDLTIDLGEWHVDRAGQAIHLTRREFKLLKVLASKPDYVLTHAEILRAIWKKARGDGMAYLRVYIKQLRGKLERIPSAPTLIVTEPGIGYRLRASGIPADAKDRGSERN